MDMNHVFTWVWICVLAFAVHNTIQKSVPRHRNSDDGLSKAVRTSLKDEDRTFICPGSGIFPHEQFCEKYYNCSTGNPTPEVWQCRTAADFLFDDTHQQCNYAYDVHCGDRHRPEDVSNTDRPPTTTTPPTTTLTPIFECTVNGPSGTYPHPLFCEQYYDCWAGVETLLTCPNNGLFDVRVDWRGCAPANTVDCGNRTRPPGEFECPVDAEDGQHYPDPWNCAAFFVCTHGHAVHTLCASGLLYNPLLGVCDYPANVDCSDRQKRSP